jgi:superfamily II DNA/RNA helicase
VKTVERQRRASAPTTSARLDEALLFGGVGPDDDRAALSGAELSADVDAQVEAATTAVPVPSDEAEQRLLAEMTAFAEASRHLPDARIDHLTTWIHANLCPGSAWNETRVIIFTEYEDTLRYLETQVRGAIARTAQPEQRIGIYRGSTPADDREEIKRAFNAEPPKHPVRILIATDAAREGLNLQAHCNNLFHFDIPWNPSRMEQRNGRIDRKLQPASDVFCYYFVYAQRPEDRILEALVRKTKLIREQLGSLSQVIDDQLEKLLKHGIQRNQVEALESKIDRAQLDAEKKQAIEDELESARERQDALRQSIEQLRVMKDKSQREVGLDEEHFRSAISCALEMLHAEPLRPAAEDGDGPRRFNIPKLDDRESSWAETMDTLRTPKPREEKLLEWRRSSPVRPVVFERSRQNHGRDRPASPRAAGCAAIAGAIPHPRIRSS